MSIRSFLRRLFIQHDQKKRMQILNDVSIRRALDAGRPWRFDVDQEQASTNLRLFQVLGAKHAFLQKMRESRRTKGLNEDRNSTEISCWTLGEYPCIIGDDMPGWYFVDSSLTRGKSYAVGTNGSLYVTSATWQPDSFRCVDDELVTYSDDELVQITDAIDAHTARNPWLLTSLLMSPDERKQFIEDLPACVK